MVPPRVPQFNWVDLGLPSGTLWLDRLVGALSPSSPGLYYQWGAVNGHTATDGYSFDEASYSEQGLDAISSDLSGSQDAARAFYGPIAKMPSSQQAQELIQNTSMQLVQPNIYRLTSLINGESIFIYGGGYMRDSSVSLPGSIRVWLNNYHDNTTADSLHGLSTELSIARGSLRTFGFNIMAIHS